MSDFDDDFDYEETGAEAHTSDGKPRPNNAYAVTANELRQFIERYKNLESEADRIREDKKELMGEITARGFDKKAFNATVKVLKLEEDEGKVDAIKELRAVAGIYLKALDKEDLEDLL